LRSRERGFFGGVDRRDEQGPTPEDFFDTRYPNDLGYGKIARVGEAGIRDALGRGLVMPAGGEWDSV